MKQMQLASNWQCKKRTLTVPIAADSAHASGWFPATVPGTVHQDLLTTGQIPDPFFGENETQVQWVGECDWMYRCEFELPTGFAAEDIIMLRCDGLDTFATVWLNGQQVLVSENMFVTQRVEVGPALRAGKNELLILFESALRHGKEREAKYGALTAWNGDASRVYVRKAQYHYGWDWGPTLLTAGPWRPVYLEAYKARIADLHCPAEVAADLKSATLPVNVTLEMHASVQPSDLVLHLALHAPGGELADEIVLPVTDDEVQHTFVIASPQLWWPRGYGEQPLYRLVASLRSRAEEYDQREQRLGLRRLRLVQEPLPNEAGTTFFFEVNTTPIFCGGANWIPADSFLPRVTPARYQTLLQLAADAHMTMLRVWGGGIYEEDSFYNLCDELGLLVWQDFMFACGLYPASSWFQESVRTEVEANVRRLRHHPCIALWCGNNEDYSVASSLHLYDKTFEGDFTTTAFPARALYERLIPEICAHLDPHRPYWPGSPYGGADVNDLHVGDQHVWHVWHGTTSYQDYPKIEARFVSEFGMESFSDLATIETFAPPAEQAPQSRTLNFHNKAGDGPRRLTAYLVENVHIPTDLASYIYATQFIQAEALGVGIRGWRRHWGNLDEQVGGALVWQLDDCWPVTSWAIVDYILRPKPAYYVVRRELAPLVVGLARSVDDQATIWAVNALSTPFNAEAELRTWTLDGVMVAEKRFAVALAAKRGAELGQVEGHQDDMHVIGALLRQDGKVVARATLWPEPFKNIQLVDPGIAIERLDTDILSIHAARPAKGVWLSAGDNVQWSDNMLDLLPDDPQTIKAQGLGERAVQVRWLGDHINRLV